MKTRRDMLRTALGLTGLGLTLAACAGNKSEDLPKVVTLRDPSARIGNVAYVRSVTGLAIPGEAWSWWEGADGRYRRGHIPVPGAVLVFRRQPKLPEGHLAIVTQLRNEREIRVSHADWGSTWATRGRITGNVPVLDVSPGNDWTQLRVWYAPTGTFERVYEAYGFVYGGTAPAEPQRQIPGVEI
jgi:hypothetical protein